MPTIADYMTGSHNSRDNNYNLLRFLAACFIAVYHCYFMALGPEMSDVRYPALYQFSQIVLNFFFITSGFLIAQSFQRRQDIISYCVARCLRLLPGLFVLAVLICFVMGPIVTQVSLAEYFSSLATWIYVPVTTALQPDAILPGVFASNINPHEIDDALWTLRYEVLCYIGLAFLGLWGALNVSRKFYFVSLAVLLGYGVITYATSLRDIAGVNHLMHFGLSFFVGTFAYVFRSLIPLHWGLALLMGGLAFTGFAFFGTLAEPLVILATAYIVFWLAYVPAGFLRRYNQFGDYSYGVYIYHYPIEQIFMFAVGGFSPLGLFLVSFPFTLICAICSWIFIEKPSLQRLSSISQWVKGRFFIAENKAT